MIRFRICPIPSSSGKDPPPTPLPVLSPRPLVSAVFVRDDWSDPSAGDMFASMRERDELLNEDVVDLNLSGTPCSGGFGTSSAAVKMYRIAFTEGSKSFVSANGSAAKFDISSRGQAC